MSSNRRGRGGLGLDRNPGPPLIVPNLSEYDDRNELVTSQNIMPPDVLDQTIPVVENIMEVRRSVRRRGRIAMAANRTVSGYVTRKSNNEVIYKVISFK
jgi:hypothetical protein